MKITKLVHSCLLVQMPPPVDRTALFDPGVYSKINVESLQYLDDIFITHQHPDHMDVELIKRLCARFSKVRITAPEDAKEVLRQAGVGNMATTAPEGVRFFDSPHETTRPLAVVDPPQELGFHYLDILSDPGDCHSFQETMPVLMLALTGPWASTASAVKVVLRLRPKYVIPVHDWSWRSEAREEMYERLESRFKEEGITFLKMKDGEPVVLKDL